MVISDSQKKKDFTHWQRIEKDILRKEEQTHLAMERVEKSLSQSFNKQIQDTEAILLMLRKRVEEVHDTAMTVLNKVNTKLKNIDETDVIQRWVVRYVDSEVQKTKSELKYNIYE